NRIDLGFPNQGVSDSPCWLGWRPAWMGKPYSDDLRKRVVAAVETGGLSCNRAARQFGVAVSTAVGWVRRRRETGSVAPGKMGGPGRRRFPANTAPGCYRGSSGTSLCAA